MLYEKLSIKPCSCTGYWFPHRRGGGACEHSLSRLFHMALRGGEDYLDASIEQVFREPSKAITTTCPF